MSAASELHQLVCDEVDAWATRLIALSHDIHAHPELNFEERYAHDALVAVAGDADLEVQPHAYGLSTAFAARAGAPDGPTVAVLCEYDALEGIGHACGHNVIAAAGIGAGIAAARVADQLGGRLMILGTPGEEGGGGKIDLIDAGAFAGVDAAIMVHPAGLDLRQMDVIAVSQYRVAYTGRASHAAAAPELGRNALDAAVLGYVGVSALRQHIAPSERIHGIFTRAGDAPNVVPQDAEAIWFVRSPTMQGLDALVERVHACLRAGATAAGCEITISEENRTFADMIDNPVLLDRYASHAAALGRPVAESSADANVTGSTDMGNVSHVVPAIHPVMKIAPSDVAIHTPEFARCAVSADGDRGVIDGAKMLAMTIVDLWSEPDLLAEARRSFESSAG